MEERYQVLWEGKAVGEAHVARKGLYYHIESHCHLPEGEIHRLVSNGIVLGVLEPKNGDHWLCTRRSIREVGELTAFFIDSAEIPDETAYSFVPLQPQEKVDCLQRICEARFAIKDGVPGLLLPSKK